MQRGETEDPLSGCTADSASSRITVVYMCTRPRPVAREMPITRTVTFTRWKGYSAFGSRIGPRINVSDSDEADLSVGFALLCSFPRRICPLKGATIFHRIVTVVVSGQKKARSSSRKDRWCEVWSAWRE
jgi:hypothetical protein